ncbi:MAG TPA: hypothetical protein VJJ26_05700 [Candidatus Babeliales bacterium]|nr:hypothetical protein [Candidatus Babeliales bacterium]
MSVKYRDLLEKVRDLKLNKDDVPTLTYEDENDLLADPVIIERQHLINLLKRFKQERITQEDLFDWIHFVWFSDFFTCADDDADCITGVVQVLEELEEEGDIMPEEVEHCLYALEHNTKVEGIF